MKPPMKEAPNPAWKLSMAGPLRLLLAGEEAASMVLATALATASASGTTG
jgi:hypothetical protein